VEPVFNTVSGVLRTALVGVSRGGATYPVLCVEREPPLPITGMWRELYRDQWGRIEQNLRESGSRFDHTRMIDQFLWHPAFPVDVRHNSKIFREKLAVWADKTLGPRWNPSKVHGRPAVGTGAPS
jgi:hypothetical protein